MALNFCFCVFKFLLLPASKFGPKILFSHVTFFVWEIPVFCRRFCRFMGLFLFLNNLILESRFMGLFLFLNNLILEGFVEKSFG
jgi:hypothetical protein